MRATMTQKEIKGALIAKVLRATLSMHKINAQRIARKQLRAKGYSDSEALTFIDEALDAAGQQANRGQP